MRAVLGQRAGKPARRSSRRRADRRRRGLVLLLMSPWILGFSIFFLYPIVTTAYMPLKTYPSRITGTIGNPDQYAGLT